MTLALIIPVKDLSEGKSRLGLVLSPIPRARLNLFLALRTFAIAREALGFARVYVVSKSEEVLTLAEHLSLIPIHEPAEATLNGAISYARLVALQDGCSECLILPVDLVYLSVDHLHEILQDGRAADVTLVPDGDGTGTNLIYWRSIEAACFLFGPNSAILHSTYALQRGLRVKSIKNGPLSFDLDLPRDLSRWWPGVGPTRDLNLTNVRAMLTA